MPADLPAVRTWIGSSTTDGDIEAQWVRFDGRDHQAELTALAILRGRRADLILGPDSFAVDGDYRESQDKASSLKALDSQIARLERITGDVVSGGPVLASAPISAPGGQR